MDNIQVSMYYLQPQVEFMKVILQYIDQYIYMIYIYTTPHTHTKWDLHIILIKNL